MDEATAAAAAAFAKAHPEGGAALLTRLRGEPQPIPASKPKRAPRVVRTPRLTAETADVPPTFAVVTPAVTLATSRPRTVNVGWAVQSTRMLKVICEEDGYAVRTTRKWIDVGLPSCPDGHEMREVDQ